MLFSPACFFVIGLVILLVFANLFVNAAVKLAYLLKISPLIIGATVMGMGTSLPEIAVSIFGTLRKSSGLVAGNIIGSNITNIGAILGASFFLGKIRIGTTKTPIMAVLHLFIALIFLTLLVYGLLIPSLGSIFILAMILVWVWQLKAGQRGAKAEDRRLFKNHEPVDGGVGAALRLVIFGLVGTFLGGKLLVDSSLNIAKLIGITPAVIGLTAVAFGTSIPELTTSIIGVLKGEEKLVVGGVLGTNIFNMLFVGGLAGLLTPLYFTNMVAIVALLGETFGLSLLVYLYKGKTVPRIWGVVLMISYLVYLFALVRG